MRAVVSRILACIHDALPHFLVEIILEDLDVEAWRDEEHAVLDVAEAVVRLEKVGDFGNA